MTESKKDELEMILTLDKKILEAILQKLNIKEICTLIKIQPSTKKVIINRYNKVSVEKIQKYILGFELKLPEDYEWISRTKAKILKMIDENYENKISKGNNEMTTNTENKSTAAKQADIEFKELLEKADNFNSFFSRLFYKATGRIKKAKERYSAQLALRNAWYSKDPFNEDTIYDLKRIVRLTQKEIIKTEKELIEDDCSEAEVEKKEKKIKDMKEEVAKKEVELAILQNIFATEYVSGIEIEKSKSILGKRIKQREGCFKMFCAWTVLYAITFILWTIAIFVVFSLITGNENYGTLFGASFVISALTMVWIIYNGYEEVPEMEEWVMQLFSRYLTNWDSGPHIGFPRFMSIKEKVYTGTWSVALNMNGQIDENGVKSSQVDFIDDTASVSAEVFFRTFDTDRAVYEIEELKPSASKNMEAGLRAYFSQKSLDEAIETREDIDLRRIITQPACSANTFKRWGVECISVAILPIDLSETTIKLRSQILEAKKLFEATEISEKTAILNANIEAAHGTGEGDKIANLAAKANIKPELALQFLLTTKKYIAAEKAKSLIMSEGSTESLNGALIGASAAAGSNSINETRIERKEDMKE